MAACSATAENAKDAGSHFHWLISSFQMLKKFKCSLKEHERSLSPVRNSENPLSSEVEVVAPWKSTANGVAAPSSLPSSLFGTVLKKDDGK